MAALFSRPSDDIQLSGRRRRGTEVSRVRAESPFDRALVVARQTQHGRFPSRQS